MIIIHRIHIDLQWYCRRLCCIHVVGVFLGRMSSLRCGPWYYHVLSSETSAKLQPFGPPKIAAASRNTPTCVKTHIATTTKIGTPHFLDKPTWKVTAMKRILRHIISANAFVAGRPWRTMASGAAGSGFSGWAAVEGAMRWYFDGGMPNNWEFGGKQPGISPTHWGFHQLNWGYDSWQSIRSGPIGINGLRTWPQRRSM